MNYLLTFQNCNQESFPIKINLFTNDNLNNYASVVVFFWFFVFYSLIIHSLHSDNISKENV